MARLRQVGGGWDGVDWKPTIEAIARICDRYSNTPARHTSDQKINEEKRPIEASLCLSLTYLSRRGGAVLTRRFVMRRWKADLRPARADSFAHTPWHGLAMDNEERLALSTVRGALAFKLRGVAFRDSASRVLHESVFVAGIVRA